MKDKLEVGMYCYNKTNRKLGIGEIINFQRNNNVNIRYKNDIELVSIGNVIASNNVIDLTEVGDYVNGYYVSKIWKSGEITHYVDEKPIQRKERQITIQAPSYGGIIHLHNEDIKSIVTKECFESMSYKVGE